MANNFDLRQFLTENKLTKNTQLLKEGSDYGYDDLMDVVDVEYDGDPAIAAAVEDAFYNGDIDTSEFGHDLSAPSRAVAQIANGMDIEAAQQSMGFEEEVQKETVKENTMTKRDKYLTRLVENALGLEVNEDDNVDYTMGRQDDPNQLPNPAPELNIPEGDEMVEEKPLPKYENIEKLMQEIDKSTDEAAHKYKMEEMKRVADGLEKKATALEEGDDSDHIDQKKLKQMKKDIMSLRKNIEKMEKLGEKKFAKKETKAELKEGFDLRNFLVENKLTSNSRTQE
jgi:hypothetical protein